MSRLGIASETGLASIWRTGVEANLDCASSFAPSGRRTFFIEAGELFHLHAAKSSTARTSLHAHANGDLVESLTDAMWDNSDRIWFCVQLVDFVPT